MSETETGAKLPAESGMVLRALQEILTAMDCESLGDGVKASISAQYIQIYQESLTDLLTGVRTMLSFSFRSKGSDKAAMQIFEAIETFSFFLLLFFFFFVRQYDT